MSTAPDLSAAEAARVAEFDAAPDLPEAYRPSSPVALLDQLDELRAKATADMPWRQDSGWGENILGASGEAIGGVEFPSDAALIVGAVNAVGPLTDAVRAVLELHVLDNGEDADDCVVCGWESGYPCATVRALLVTP